MSLPVLLLRRSSHGARAYADRPRESASVLYGVSYSNTTSRRKRGNLSGIGDCTFSRGKSKSVRTKVSLLRPFPSTEHSLSRRALPRASAVGVSRWSGSYCKSFAHAHAEVSVEAHSRHDTQVADIPVDHPSTSKQHAVLQFRQVTERNEFGDTKSLTKSVPSFPWSIRVAPKLNRLRVRCRPFVIDLDSANGTMVNEEAVPPSRFYELKSGDGESPIYRLIVSVS